MSAATVTVELPVSGDADSGYWTANQDQPYGDRGAVSACVLVGRSYDVRPVAIRYGCGGMSGSVLMPREQARRLGLALLAAAEYDAGDAAEGGQR